MKAAVRHSGKLISAVAAVALAGCATSAPAPSAGRAAASFKLWSGFQDHPGGYSDPKAGEAINAARFVPAPPAEGSAQLKDDWDTYRATRSLAGTPRWAQAAADNEIETPKAPFKAFACALGADIDPATTPTLTVLLAKVLGEVQIAQGELKTATFRQRPFVAEPAATCIAPEVWLGKSSSYPSGHSATGFGWGLILSEIAPSRREEIVKRGMAYGESRMICGVHFRSDVEMGRTMGAAIVASLQSKPAFRQDLEVARGELARAMASGSAPADCGAGRI